MVMTAVCCIIIPYLMCEWAPMYYNDKLYWRRQDGLCNGKIEVEDLVYIIVFFFFHVYMVMTAVCCIILRYLMCEWAPMGMIRFVVFR